MTGSKDPKLYEALKLYEDGKHRRYVLLFSVNGGAFAIAKLISEKDVGALHIGQLSVGMIIFTILMVFDISTFGIRMRAPNMAGDQVFNWPGWLVLGVIGLLICGGWGLAAAGS
jgi:hypothetical protein